MVFMCNLGENGCKLNLKISVSHILLLLHPIFKQIKSNINDEIT